MRKFLLIGLVFSLAACSGNKWNKQALVNDCLKDMNKRQEIEKLFNTVQVATLCDCMSDKLLAKYKSARESNKDEAGATQIGKECALELMSK